MPAGEFDLIDRYFSSLTEADSSLILGPGDDAAIVRVPAEEDLLVAVDTLVQGVHFFPGTSPSDLGFKSLAVNASDIAAMGGIPRWATLSLTLEDADETWLSEFASGFASLARDIGVQLIGGDTTRGPLSISVQLCGLVKKNKGIRRDGARTGDLLYVSGYPGLAALALKFLKQGNALNEGTLAMQRLHRPEPRTELGRRLNDIASAAIDVSDGLVADLSHVLKASGQAAEIELKSLPVFEELKTHVDTEEAYRLILEGGDDYELCFTIPRSKSAVLAEISEVLDYPIYCIGSIVEGRGIRFLNEDGSEKELDIEGWQHF